VENKAGGIRLSVIYDSILILITQGYLDEARTTGPFCLIGNQAGFTKAVKIIAALWTSFVDL